MNRFHAPRAATPRQANLILAVCSKAFGLAELWEMRPERSNPCSKIERYPENHRERFLSAEELWRLGATLRNGRATLEKRRSYALQAGHDRSGRTSVVHRRRLSEVLRLRLEQVDFAAGTIALLETKSGRPQVVTMNAPARQALKELEAAKASEWVLPSVSSVKRSISKAGIEAAWHRIRTAAQLEDVQLHDLRHTVGTYAGQSGANAFLVRELLRHKNLAMTGSYVNRADSPVRTLSDQVGERISAAMEGRPAAEVVPLKVSTASPSTPNVSARRSRAPR